MEAHPDDGADQRTWRIRDLRRFCVAFGIEHDYDSASKTFAFDPDNVVGQTGTVDVRQREWPEGSGEFQNELNLSAVAD